MNADKTPAFLKLETKLKNLRQQAVKDELNPDQIGETFYYCTKLLDVQKSNSNCLLICLVGVGIAVALCGVALNSIQSSLHHEPCLINKDTLPPSLIGPITDCSMCEDLLSIPLYDAITREEFEVRHAYTNRPALIRNAIQNWTALTQLNFNYLKEMYLSSNIDDIQENCAFFAYRTDFLSLKDAFESITPAMQNLEDGAPNWYIGWSNCDEHIRSMVKQMTQKPYFLPERSVCYSTWIFVGTPGIGAGIHIDSVELPSWQAQIMGSKTWTLTPPPECENVCQTISATLNPGDIIVVNTNQWYHSTLVHKGSISLSIGSEYD
ncbi:uncharacterized protein [Antedon mediterranea]|uniref:uncharacterized protein n=1 Tax=Antedon mediterranea TaxID=105859 RepID=UPI003AF94DA6